MPTYLSEHVYTGNGSQTDYVFNKGYLSRSHVIVKVSTDAGATFTTKVDPTHYSWIDSGTIRFVTAPALNAVVWLDRVTPKTIDLTYANGTVFTDVTQNYDYRQPMYILQEQEDDLSRRPSLNVLQDDVEQTLASVLGALTIDGSTLTKTTFDLKAVVGNDSNNILTVALSKLNQVSANLSLPSGYGARVGGIRIKDFSPTYFGTITAVIAAATISDWDAYETSIGALRTAYAKVWDGTFPFWKVSGSKHVAYAGPSPDLPGVQHLLMPMGNGTYTRLSDATNRYTSGSYEYVDVIFLGGSYILRYRKIASNDSVGVYEVDPTYVINPQLTAAGYTPRATIELELF